MLIGLGEKCRSFSIKKPICPKSGDSIFYLKFVVCLNKTNPTNMLLKGTSVEENMIGRKKNIVEASMKMHY